MVAPSIPPTTLFLAPDHLLKAVSLSQLLLLYDVEIEAIDTTLEKLKSGEGHYINVDNIPDLPLLLLGLKDCGITAHPVPF